MDMMTFVQLNIATLMVLIFLLGCVLYAGVSAKKKRTLYAKYEKESWSTIDNKTKGYFISWRPCTQVGVPEKYLRIPFDNRRRAELYLGNLPDRFAKQVIFTIVAVDEWGKQVEHPVIMVFR